MLSVEKRPPSSQKLSQAILLALAVQTAANLYFDHKGLWGWLQLAGVITAFFQARQMEWIAINHKSPCEHPFVFQRHILSAVAKLKNPEITYFALLPYTWAHKNDECAIGSCEVGALPNSYYCSNKHRFCKSCLTDHYVSKVKELSTWLFDRDRFALVFHFKSTSSGYSYHTNTSYTFHFKEDELPRCPSCREAASHAFLDFKQGMIKTHEEETNAKSSFWSTCFLVYSAAQLALAAAGYTHPHLAPTLYDIQTYALPLDAIFAGGLFYSEAKMFHIVPEKNKEMIPLHFHRDRLSQLLRMLQLTEPNFYSLIRFLKGLRDSKSAMWC